MTGPGNPDLVRIGTQEREDAVRVLGEHFSAGRLDVNEYEQRVGQASAAQTLGDLRVLFVDLPAPHPPFLAPPPPPVAPMPPAFAGHPLAAGQPGYGLVQPPLSDKSRIAAGVLQIVLPFGIGRFYTGHTGLAIGQLLATLFTLGAGALWSIIDGIVLLANGGSTDGSGRRLRS